MSYVERTFTVGFYTVQIVRDDDAHSPDDNVDTSLFLAYSTRNVAAGRKGYARDGADHVTGYHVFTLGIYEGPYTILTLGAEVAPRGDDDDDDDADRGPGYVYVSRAEWPDAGDAARAAEAIVNEWNGYLSGDVYGYRVKDPSGYTVDSCWGYTGDPDESGAVDDARASAEAFVANDERDAATERAAGNDPATPPADGDSAGPGDA